MAALWTPGVSIVGDEPMLAKNAWYREIDARLAELPRGPPPVRELADEGARGVVMVQVVQ